MLFSSSLVSFALLFSSSASLVLGAAPIPTSSATSGCPKLGGPCILSGSSTPGICDKSLKCVPKCGTAGAKRCSTTTKLQVCQSNGLWADSVDCAATGLICDNSTFKCVVCIDGTVACIGGYENKCINNTWEPQYYPFSDSAESQAIACSAQ